MKLIHVAGTKGKGSTCAFIESFLRVYSKRNYRTGLYTSPHLISPTERIRINFQPLSEDLFAQYVFEVRDRLHLCQNEGPGFLQLLALVSFHAFIRQEVDVALFETHHGGEYDATNVIERPVVTVITSIGEDHIVDLGSTLENIAWHKAGILKRGAPAFTTTQQPNVLRVLKSRAIEKGVELNVVEEDTNLQVEFDDPVQRLNCSLARAATDAFLLNAEPLGLLSEHDILTCVKQSRWPGRFEIIQNLDDTWFLDGAHNEMSIAKAAEWFQRASLKR